MRYEHRHHLLAIAGHLTSIVGHRSISSRFLEEAEVEDELQTATMFHDALRYPYDLLRCIYHAPTMSYEV